MKCIYLMSVIYDEFCLRMGAVNRPELRFNCHTWLEGDYG